MKKDLVLKTSTHDNNDDDDGNEKIALLSQVQAISYLEGEKVYLKLPSTKVMKVL